MTFATNQLTPVAAAVAEATDAPHFEAGPSSLNRVINCPGSVQLSRGLADTPSDAASHGTRLHAFADLCIKTRTTPEDHPTDGDWAVYSDEDRDAVASAIECVRDLLIEFPGELLSEIDVDLSSYWPGMFGRADVAILSGRTLVVVDFKFGRVKIPATSPQLKAYAAGLLADFEFVEFDRVVCCIVQPTIYHYDRAEYTADEVLTWASDVMVPTLSEAFGPNPRVIPGDVQCQYCRAGGICRARKEAHFDEVSEILDSVADGRVLTSEELGAVLSKADRFLSTLDAMQSHALRELVEGRAVPGMKAVESVTRRKWADPDTTPQKLYEALIAKDPTADPVAALGQVTVVAPITITAAEKLLGKKNPALSGLTVKPEGRPTLAPESDPRPVFATKAAAIDALDSVEIL